MARLSNCLDTAEKQRISLLKDLDEERSKNTQLLKAQSQKASEATPSNSKHDDDEDDDDPEVNIDVFFFFFFETTLSILALFYFSETK